MRRVLLIDDNTEMYSVVQDALKKPEYQVEFCSDPFGALPLLEQTPFDLVLCDIKMPGVTGLVLVEELRRQGIKTPVLFITGDLNEDAAREVLRLRATGVVEKPFRLSELRERVGRILSGK